METGSCWDQSWGGGGEGEVLVGPLLGSSSSRDEVLGRDPLQRAAGGDGILVGPILERSPRRLGGPCPPRTPTPGEEMMAPGPRGAAVGRSRRRPSSSYRRHHVRGGGRLPSPSAPTSRGGGGDGWGSGGLGDPPPGAEEGWRGPTEALGWRGAGRCRSGVLRLRPAGAAGGDGSGRPDVGLGRNWHPWVPVGPHRHGWKLRDPGGAQMDGAVAWSWSMGTPTGVNGDPCPPGTQAPRGW